MISVSQREKFDSEHFKAEENFERRKTQVGHDIKKNVCRTVFKVWK